METKFLSDGRKVVVCGKINKTEYIVQEVFVTDNGDEVPSGDNFTTKSLHDKPVETYLSRKNADLEKAIHKLEVRQTELKKEVKTLAGKREGAAALLKRTNFVAESLPDFDWDKFSDIISGNIKYVVDYSYGITISKFEDKAYIWWNSYGDAKYEGIRSFTLYSKGYGRDLEYRIGNYADLSGSSMKFECYTTEEELCKDLEEWLLSKHKDGKLSLDSVAKVAEYITVPSYIYTELKAKRESEIQEQYNNALESAEKLRKQNMEKL